MNSRRCWFWPWTRRDTEGIDDADRAVESSLRGLGAVEQRTEHVDSLATRAAATAGALATERRTNHFNERIRNTLGGKPA